MVLNEDYVYEVDWVPYIVNHFSKIKMQEIYVTDIFWWTTKISNF